MQVHRQSFPQGLLPFQQLFLPILPLQAHPGVPHTVTEATAPWCEQGNPSQDGRTICFSCLATEGTRGDGGDGEGGCEVHHEGCVMPLSRTTLPGCLLLLVGRTQALCVLPSPVPVCLREWGGGSYACLRSLPTKTSFFRDRRAQRPPFPLAGREAAALLSLAQAGAASPCPPHRNHKFTVGLLHSPPILRSCYLPRPAAYLGAWGWVRAVG